MTSPVRVLLLSPDGPVDGAVMARSGVQGHNCADLSDLIGRAAAGAADVIAVSPRAAGLDAAIVTRLRGLGCRTLALVTGPSDVALARRVGLTESVAVPLDRAALLALLQCDPAGDAPGTDAGAPRGTVVALWGPPGSPGRTTVAALLAVGAVRSGRTVAVVDADLAAPQWSLLAPRPITGSGLIIAARRVATGMLDVSDLLLDLAPGLGLLPLAAEPDRWIEVAPDLIGQVLRSVASCVDVVVVDLGADIRAAHPAYDIGWAHDSGAVARNALCGADAVVAVMSAEPVGVHRFASWWPVLRAQAQPALVVANRVGLPRAGRRPAEQLASVLAALGAPSDPVHVPWEPRAADGLLEPTWHAARGWRDLPERLWSAVGAHADAASGARMARV